MTSDPPLSPALKEGAPGEHHDPTKSPTFFGYLMESDIQQHAIMRSRLASHHTIAGKALFKACPESGLGHHDVNRVAPWRYKGVP